MPAWRKEVRKLPGRLWAAIDPAYGLCSSDKARDEHLEVLLGALGKDDFWRLQEWLHRSLDVIDSKANSLLQYNSILFAAITFLIIQPRNHASLPRVALSTALALTLVNALRLARTSFVYWSSTDDYRHPDAELRNLLRVRDTRTKVVRASWGLGVLALLLVGGVLFADLTNLTKERMPAQNDAEPTMTRGRAQGGCRMNSSGGWGRFRRMICCRRLASGARRLRAGPRDLGSRGGRAKGDRCRHRQITPRSARRAPADSGAVGRVQVVLVRSHLLLS